MAVELRGWLTTAEGIHLREPQAEVTTFGSPQVCGGASDISIEANGWHFLLWYNNL
jgi:hypothetical protein